MCGNLRQRRGDIHVARVRALSWFGGMRLAVPATGVINGAPTGYAAVRSWCSAVFSFVHVGTAGYATVRSWCPVVFFIRACGNRRQRRGDIHVARVGALLRCVCVRHVRSVASVSLACAPSCPVGVCLSAPVPGVINGAPTLRLFDGYDGAVCFSLALKGNVSRVGRPICRPFVRQGETFVRSVRRSGGARRRVSGRTCAGCSRGRASGSSL